MFDLKEVVGLYLALIDQKKEITVYQVIKLNEDDNSILSIAVKDSKYPKMFSFDERSLSKAALFKTIEECLDYINDQIENRGKGESCERHSGGNPFNLAEVLEAMNNR